jgi:hypothetical protein
MIFDKKLIIVEKDVKANAVPVDLSPFDNLEIGNSWYVVLHKADGSALGAGATLIVTTGDTAAAATTVVETVVATDAKQAFLVAPITGVKLGAFVSFDTSLGVAVTAYLSPAFPTTIGEIINAPAVYDPKVPA